MPYTRLFWRRSTMRSRGVVVRFFTIASLRTGARTHTTLRRWRHESWRAMLLALAAYSHLGCGSRAPGGAPRRVGTPEGDQACGAYFDAAMRCGRFLGNDYPLTLPLPAATRDAFIDACSAALTQPGYVLTAQDLQFCANQPSCSAFQQCVGSPDVATPTLLPEGASCVVGIFSPITCQSGACVGNKIVADRFVCGTCAAVDGGTPPCSCTPGERCRRSVFGDQCLPLAAGNEGDPCNAYFPKCNPGLICYTSGSGPRGVCSAPKSVGASCASNGECEGALYCTSSNQGVCAALASNARDPCNPNTNMGCGGGLACIPADGGSFACEPLQWGSPGMPCNGWNLRCGESVACTTAFLCPSLEPCGTCPVVLGEGAACVPGDSAHVCAINATCYRGVCTRVVDIACP
jgi:hypothetical protein